MRVWQTTVDLFDHMHGKNRTIGLAGELVGSVAGPHGDGQRIHLRLGSETLRLGPIGPQLDFRQFPGRAVIILLIARPLFRRAEEAEFLPTDTPQASAISSTCRVAATLKS